MRKSLALVFILALVGCGSGQKLTVMTYNIHHGEGNDKKLDLPRIAGVIGAAKADIVALQEVDLGAERTGRVAQAQELAKLTGMHFVNGPAMDFQGGKYGDAVLSRFPIRSWRFVMLPWTEGKEREPRVAVVTTCVLPNDRKLIFVSTHFDHTHEPSDRYLQAKAVNHALEERSKHAFPAILAGDFNCEVGSPPMQELMSQWKLVTDADPTLTCPSDRPKEKIDHIFVRPGERWKVVEVKVIDEEVASDHRPVMAKLELKSK
jgi:endonuclease/exonuclease/phosphatase family metal-dependent hydrolase